MVSGMQHRIGRRSRSAIPAVWLLSDPVRLPDPMQVLARLPRGAAVLLRGAAPELAARGARACRARGLTLLISVDGRLALRLGAGLHVPDRTVTRHLLPFLLNRRGRLLSAAMHGRAGLARARRLSADVALVSPAFPTASHPGAPALGALRWAALARAAPFPAVALGGMSALAMRRLPPGSAAGWAAIGVWQAGGAVAQETQCLKEVAPGA